MTFKAASVASALQLVYPLFFFLNDPAPPDISPLPLPAALPISPPQRLEAVGVRFRGEPRVWGMDLPDPDPQAAQPAPVPRRILGEPGVHAPVRQQPLRIGLG